MFEPVVFISHKSEDKPRIRPIVEALLNEGFIVWIDKPSAFRPKLEHANLRQIASSEDWNESISRALISSGCVLALWSQHCEASHQVKREIRTGRCRNAIVYATIDGSRPGERAIGKKPQWRSLVAEIEAIKTGAAARDALGDLFVEIDQVMRRWGEGIAPAGRIGAASSQPIAVYSGTAAGPVVSDRLVYQLDRARAIANLAEALMPEVAPSRRKPVVALVCGTWDDEPRKFHDQLEARTDRHIGYYRRDFELITYPIIWDNRDQAGHVLERLGRALNVRARCSEVGDAVFSRALGERLCELAAEPANSAVLFKCYIGQWTREDAALLAACLKAFRTLPVPPTAPLPAVVLTLAQQAHQAPSGLGRLFASKAPPNIATFVDGLKPADHPELALIKLGRMENISPQDGINWIDEVLKEHASGGVAAVYDELRDRLQERFAVVADGLPLKHAAQCLLEELGRIGFVIEQSSD